jgi:hypothetical protein
MAERLRTEEPDYDEDLDDIDFGNYKGIFYEDDPTTKYQDPETGAHFDFDNICSRLHKIKVSKERNAEIGGQNKLSAKEKLRLKLNQPESGSKRRNANQRIETEYSDPEDETEMSVLDEHYMQNKENYNDHNFEDSNLNDQQKDFDKINKGLEFKNKFIDHVDNSEILFHRRNKDGNKVIDPMHFMHKIHQTEEDDENAELIDEEFPINEL